MKEKKLSSGNKALIAGGVLVTGGALFFVWDKLFKKKDTSNITEESTATIVTNNVIFSAASSRNDRFPLKRGSLGNRVRLLQLAVQKVLGKGRFPDIEIDGDYGPKTESAVISAGFPVSIDEAAFNRITANISSAAIVPVFNARVLSGQLATFAASGDLNGVLSILRQFKGTEDYKAVNQYFIDAQVLSVSRSIVTYLLDISFPTNEYAKQQIRKEFLRMGLKSTASDPINQNGSWSLSGFKKDITTITDTYVLDKLNRKIPVAEKTILGEEIQIKNGMTFFKGLDGQMYSVPTIRVKYA